MRINLENFIHQKNEKKVNILGVHVRQHGQAVGAFHWNDSFERRCNINSCSKSVTSLAVGIAIKEGLLSLDEKVCDAFKDSMPERPQDWLLDLTIRDMMIMASGHDSNLLPRIGRDVIEEQDWVRYVLRQPLAFPPGTHFQYNNMGPYLCSVLIEMRSGELLINWLKPRLFHPLGIKNPQWFTCPKGHTLGAGGLFLTPEELGRIGQVCLSGGLWEGVRLVPEEYIKTATAKHIDSTYEESPTPDFCSGYGYYFWRNSKVDSYRGWGSSGQHMLVLPQQDAVVSVLSDEKDSKGIMDAIWEGLLPLLEENA